MRRRALLLALALVLVVGAVALVGSLASSDHKDGGASPSPRVAARVPIRGSSTAIAAGEGGVWVGVERPDGGAVVRIDPTTNAVATEIPLPAVPDDLVAGSGAVWASAEERHRGPAVFRIDPSTNRVTAEVDGVSGPLAVDAGGVWAIARGTGVWKLALVRFDPQTTRVQLRRHVEAVPAALATGAGSVWVLDSGKITRYSSDSGRPEATIRVGSDRTGLAAGDGGAWVSGGTTALRIDPSTNRPSGLPLEIGPARPFAVVGSRLLYVGRRGVCSLTPTTGDPGTCTGVGSRPLSATLDESGRSIWAVAGDAIVRIDLEAT